MAQRKIATDINLLNNAVRNFSANPLTVTTAGDLPKAVAGGMFYSKASSKSTFDSVSDGTLDNGSYEGGYELKANTLYLCDGEVWFPIATGSSMETAISEIHEYINQYSINRISTATDGKDDSESEDLGFYEGEDGAPKSTLETPGKVTVYGGDGVSVEVHQKQDATKPDGILIKTDFGTVSKDNVSKPVAGKAVQDKLDYKIGSLKIEDKAGQTDELQSKDSLTFIEGNAVKLTDAQDTSGNFKGIQIDVQTDEALNADSTNPVQNKAIKKELDTVKSALATCQLTSVSPNVFFFDKSGATAVTVNIVVHSNLVMDEAPTGTVGSYNIAFTKKTVSEGDTYEGTATIPASANIKAASYGVTVHASVGGKKFTPTSTIYAVDHIYIKGDGATFTDNGTGILSGAKRSPNGQYAVTLTEGQYLWIAVPTGMTVNTVMLLGQASFAIPMLAADTTTKSGYNLYRSQSSYHASTINISIS